MSLSARIAPHLPLLRRFSRAVSGSQTSGDALVAATLEAIIADPSIFPEASSRPDRPLQAVREAVHLRGAQVPDEQPLSAWESRVVTNLSTLAPLPRQAFLLVAVEGFNESEAAESSTSTRTSSANSSTRPATRFRARWPPTSW
jgi:DNA-directed RNA polymerase specialized sigma24 family protein